MQTPHNVHAQLASTIGKETVERSAETAPKESENCWSRIYRAIEEFYRIPPAKALKRKVHQKEEHYADTRYHC
jgi:hypothetical protein